MVIFTSDNGGYIGVELGGAATAIRSTNNAPLRRARARSMRRHSARRRIVRLPGITPPWFLVHQQLVRAYPSCSNCPPAANVSPIRPAGGGKMACSGIAALWKTWMSA